MKKLLSLFLVFTTFAVCLCGCSGKTDTNTSASNSSNSDKISIVTTGFASYDFARQIAQDKANVTMLLKPGAETHSYEPSPQDIITIQKSQMFVYCGGESDEWVSNVLMSMDTSKINIVKMMDCVDLVQEEIKEGMQEEDKEESQSNDDPEMDEHVWSSPINAKKIVQKMSDDLCKIDSANSSVYKANTKDYLEKLTKLDKQFRNVIDNAKRKEIIVGDRFPFKYFCKEYGLDYYAAFPGCASETEASSTTIAFLIDKVKQDKIPVVFHIELSNDQMAESICSATGAKCELLNAVHNVSQSDFDNGVTYIDLMGHNVDVLKVALN